MKSFFLTLALVGLASAEPFVVNDGALRDSFQNGIGKFADDGNHLSGDDLAEALKKAPLFCKPPLHVNAAPTDPTESVYLIGTVYKCGMCDQWHPGGVATAWCLAADGVMVTNHHVFAQAKGAAMGICDRKGNTWPVTGILAANPAADLAIFRVAGNDFTPFPLGKSADVGDDVQVVSHPDGRFYMQTFGDVSRYHVQSLHDQSITWMSITADYAKGSSGGPVLNVAGQVVGMVASTQSIYYNSTDGKPKGPLQMVVKNCVPVSAITAMLRPEAETAEGL